MARKPSSDNKSSYDKVRDKHDNIPAKDKGDQRAARKIDKTIDKIDKRDKGGSSDNSGGNSYGPW